MRSRPSEAEVAADLLRWTVGLKLDAFITDLERRYAPDQPRVPAGSPDGGQWTLAGETLLPRSDARRTVLVALSGRLWGQRTGVDGTGYFRSCTYQDMLGRQYTIFIDASEKCKDVYRAPPYKGS